MEIERQRLVNSGGIAAPLWSEMPEFAGMTRAARPERERKRKRDTSEAEAGRGEPRGRGKGRGGGGGGGGGS